MLSQLLIAMMLTACGGGSDPVADNAVAPPDNLVGDQAATGLAAPANAAAAEAVQQAALPAAAGGMAWSVAADRSAQFGPAGSPAFSIQCQKQREGPKQLIFVRYIAAPAGAKATMSFTGNGQVASAPVTGIANPAGPGGQWRSVVDAGDIARDIAEAFAGNGPVEVGISGTTPLVVPTSPVPRSALADCLRG